MSNFWSPCSFSASRGHMASTQQLCRHKWLQLWLPLASCFIATATFAQDAKSNLSVATGPSLLMRNDRASFQLDAAAASEVRMDAAGRTLPPSVLASVASKIDVPRPVTAMPRPSTLNWVPDRKLEPIVQAPNSPISR